MKVAGYCRVSTDKADQANSFEAQKRYFCEYIQNHPGWELYRIYADEGITGTSTKKRTQFNQMMNDAYEGKYRMIITKEVSRFSRNILDTISYSRELRAIGVGIIFATDQINTLEPDSEMLLSFLASMAQEESRRTSSRVVWGQTRQMERGVVFGRSLLGYDVKDGIITVNQEGAEVVRLIFYKYAVEQCGTTEIARYLTRKGCRTSTGSGKWTPNSIIKILKNEKYAGDLIQRKTYTLDFLTHEKRANRGAVPLIIQKNHHEPIISREIWNLTQERLQKNNKHTSGQGGHSNRYVFSGKIKCGICGASFVSRTRYGKEGRKTRRWSCATAAREGKESCKVGKLVRDDDAMEMLKTAIRNLPMDFDGVIQRVTQLACDAVLAGRPEIHDQPRKMQQQIDRIRQLREAAMDAYFSREISREDMHIMLEKYDFQLISLNNSLEEAIKQMDNQPDPADVRAEIQTVAAEILRGERESEGFYKTMLDALMVFQDRHMELRLKELPMIFLFSG